MILGCIGDDFTGSSDLGLTLAQGGMRTVQYCGVPNEAADAGVEAGIVALKTRTAPVRQTVEESLAALRAGCGRRVAGSSSSRFAQPSIRPGKAISVPSSMRWRTSCKATSRSSSARPFRPMAGRCSTAICSSATG